MILDSRIPLVWIHNVFALILKRGIFRLPMTGSIVRGFFWVHTYMSTCVYVDRKWPV